MDAQCEEALSGLFANNPSRSNYLVHWSSTIGYIYVETPKVACTTIKRVLQLAELGGQEQLLPKDTHDRGSSPINRVSDDLEGFLALLARDDVFKFCFVRNPFTRALSCYLDKFVQNDWERARLCPQLGFEAEYIPTFHDFLLAVKEQPEADRDIHWSAQTYLLRPNRFRYSFIGRFEFFDKQFSRVCDTLCLGDYTDLLATHHATSADFKRMHYFGPDEIALVQSIYEQDFRNFGYGWRPDIL